MLERISRVNERAHAAGADPAFFLAHPGGAAGAAAAVRPLLLVLILTGIAHAAGGGRQEQVRERAAS